MAEFAQSRVGFGVRQIVSDVREPCALGFQVGNYGERLIDGEMHRMRNVAQRVNDEVVEPGEQLR